MKPGGKKGEWTSEEDEQIMRLQKEWGNKWTKIAKSEYWVPIYPWVLYHADLLDVLYNISQM